jgi:hypothetical protein
MVATKHLGHWTLAPATYCCPTLKVDLARDRNWTSSQGFSIRWQQGRAFANWPSTPENGSIGRCVLSVSLCAEVPNAIFDVADGGRTFATAFGLIEGGNSRMRWSRAATVSFSLLLQPFKISTADLSRENDPTHPDPQRSLLVWACCGVGSGEVVDGSFQRIVDSWRKKNRPLVPIHVKSETRQP